MLFLVKAIFAACAGALGMILGVTNNPDGTPIIRLAKAYKVSIGIPASGDKNYPQKSDHFHIRAKNATGEWVDDKPFMEQLQRATPEVETPSGKVRPPLREIEVVLLSSDIEDVFKTEYAWWAASEKKCSGDGLHAERKVSALPEKDRVQYKDKTVIPWKPCGDGCPELEKGLCKPSGELVFIFKERPIMGSVASFTTTSYESIRRIHSSLLQIQSVTGGRLRGIPLKMVVRPGKTRYQQDGKTKTGSAFFVNIEFRKQDYAELIPALLQHSVQYEHSLTTGRRLIAENIEDDETIDVEETPEVERAAEMAAEFPNAGTLGTVPGSTSATVADPEEAEIIQMFNALGLNPAHRETLYQTLKGDISEVRSWIGRFADACARFKMNPMQIQQFFTSIVGQPDKLQAAIDAFAQAPMSTPEAPKRARAKKPEGTVVPPVNETPTQQPGPEPPKPEPEAPKASMEAEAGEWNF